jgi:hypothetical protein
MAILKPGKDPNLAFIGLYPYPQAAIICYNAHYSALKPTYTAWLPIICKIAPRDIGREIVSSKLL